MILLDGSTVPSLLTMKMCDTASVADQLQGKRVEEAVVLLAKDYSSPCCPKTTCNGAVV